MSLVACPSGFCYLNSGMILLIIICSVVFLAADIEENIIKLLKTDYFMIGCVVIFVMGVEVYFCLCQN